MSTKLTSKMLRQPGQAKEEPNLLKQVLIVNLAAKTHYVNQVKNDYHLFKGRLYLYRAAHNHKANPGEKFWKLH